ncbi:alpha/beta hydrolase family protein [Lutimonas sp.]|uniref:alpha/beta hydrolase family protein n=1 Tax=Lutimonas sp. TaxID=1872403 RepID=UPI003D9ADC30
MKFTLFYLLAITFYTLVAQNHIAPGIYSGTFKQGKFKTDVEFDIRSVDNSYHIKFNSLAQNAFGIPAGDVNLINNTLEFALQSDYYRYDFSSLPSSNNELKTTMTVDGNSYNFKLLKKNENLQGRFRSKNIRFRSSDLLLYGTIYYPDKSNGKAIYLVTSSGNQDRSASRAEAMLFAEAGFISFHIDKRGTGISDGNWQLASIPELCEDDLHALEFLHQSEKIAYANIGIKGSSQGGTKVPYLLTKEPRLAFGIAVSCPASTLLESDLNYWENRNKEVIKPEDMPQASALQKTVFQYISEDVSKEEMNRKVKENESAAWLSHVWIPQDDQVVFDKKLNFSPMPYFKAVVAPLLVIQGSEDEIIPLQSLDLIKADLKESGNEKNKYILLKGANHSMMQPDNPDFKYWQSLHPSYMSSMLKWAQKL